MYVHSNGKYEEVKEYAKRGLALFPVHTNENENGKCSCGNDSCGSVAKHPLTLNGVKDATTDPEKLKEYFSGEYERANVGVATGVVSNIWVIDEDVVGSLQALEHVYGNLPQTPTVATGKGRHLYFRLPQNVRIPNSQKRLVGIDVRGEGGYAILPPSVHANGRAYTWLVSPSETPFAYAPDWLVNLAITEKASNTKTVERARTLDERVRLYLERTPPAVSGSGGHDHTYAVLCRLLECFPELRDYGDDNVLSLVEDWNERCSPSWNDKELRHKLTSARKRVGDVVVGGARNNTDNEDEYPVIHQDAYYGLAGEIVRAIDPETETHPASVLVTLLTCFGNVVGKGPFFAVGSGEHFANLFTAIVGDTSSAKGQSFSIVKKLMAKVDTSWTKEAIAYGLSSGEGLVERVNDPEGSDPFTVIPQKKLLCLETEFARPITAMRREGNTLSPLLRAAWDGQTLEVMTRGKSRLRASNAHVSVVAHITPDELSKLVNDSVETTNGFANRFLWVLITSTKSLPLGGDDSVLDRFVEPLLAALATAKTIRKVQRSPEADRLWEREYETLKNSFGRATERARPQVVRLAMLYALLDCSPTIKVDHLRAALAVWRFCEESATILFSTNDENEGGKLARRLRDIVRSRPGIMRSELRHAVSHKTKTTAFDTAINWLVQRNDIVCVPVQEERQADRYYPGLGDKGDVGSSVQATSPTSPYVPPETKVGLPPTSPTSPLPPAETNTEEAKTATSPHTKNVSEKEFVESLGNVVPATIAELLNWRNANGASFVRKDGSIWVTNEDRLTPAISAAIHANQEMLSFFVKGAVPFV